MVRFEVTNASSLPSSQPLPQQNKKNHNNSRFCYRQMTLRLQDVSCSCKYIFLFTNIIKAYIIALERTYTATSRQLWTSMTSQETSGGRKAPRKCNKGPDLFSIRGTSTVHHSISVHLIVVGLCAVLSASDGHSRSQSFYSCLTDLQFYICKYKITIIKQYQ